MTISKTKANKHEFFSEEKKQFLLEKTQNLIRKANKIGPMIGSYKFAIARGPDLPEEIVEALKRDGFTRLWLPEVMGGAELPPVEYFQVIEALSQYDGSVGWCASIASTGGRIAGFLPIDTATALLGNKGFVAGSLMPNGVVKRTRNGWRVVGTWPFGSFIKYSDATLAMCIEHDKDGPCITKEGGPVLRMVVVPTSSVRIVSLWNGAGLRSSGTHDFAIDNLIIDDANTFQLNDFSAVPCQSGNLYKLPFITMFALGITAVSLGLARGAIDAFAHLAQKKISTGSKKKLNENSQAQVKIAEAETLLQSARAFLFSSVQDFWDTQEDGTTPSMRQRALVRMASCNTVQVGKMVTAMMFSAAGANAVNENEPFAAFARDAQVVAQHLAFSPNNLETAGKILLGIDAGTARF